MALMMYLTRQTISLTDAQVPYTNNHAEAMAAAAAGQPPPASRCRPTVVFKLGLHPRAAAPVVRSLTCAAAGATVPPPSLYTHRAKHRAAAGKRAGSQAWAHTRPLWHQPCRRAQQQTSAAARLRLHMRLHASPPTQTPPTVSDTGCVFVTARGAERGICDAWYAHHITPVIVRTSHHIQWHSATGLCLFSGRGGPFAQHSAGQHSPPGPLQLAGSRRR
jgi:hypothetical protein